MGKFTINANDIKKICQYCNKETTAANITRHENSCYLNPKNIKLCPVCQKPIKKYKGNTTCSGSCANTFFRSGEDNPNWKGGNSYEGVQYRRICFEHHKKECIICGEDKIVAVHHLDSNHENEDPKNLVPLCPTHHQYMHSGYKSLIEEHILNYIEEFSIDI